LAGRGERIREQRGEKTRIPAKMLEVISQSEGKGVIFASVEMRKNGAISCRVREMERGSGRKNQGCFASAPDFFGFTLSSFVTLRDYVLKGIQVFEKIFFGLADLLRG